MFGNDRTAIRRFLAESWRKYRHNQTLEPLEQLIVDVIQQHPEYHALLEAPEHSLARDFFPEAGEGNPFMHLGMHIGIQEQVAADRPSGITALHQAMVRKLGDPHAAEHRLMECLGQMMWEAQQTGRMPDEQLYLECIQRLIS